MKNICHPQGINCWSSESATVLKEGDKEALPTTTKSTNVEEAVVGKEASSMEAGGGFIICEVEEQQAVRVEAQATEKKSGDTCGIGRNARLERRRCGYPSQEEVEEIGFVPSAVSESLWALHLCDKNAANRASRISNSRLL